MFVLLVLVLLVIPYGIAVSEDQITLYEIRENCYRIRDNSCLLQSVDPFQYFYGDEMNRDNIQSVLYFYDQSPYFRIPISGNAHQFTIFACTSRNETETMERRAEPFATPYIDWGNATKIYYEFNTKIAGFRINFGVNLFTTQTSKIFGSEI